MYAVITFALVFAVSSFPLSEEFHTFDGSWLSRRSRTGFFASHPLSSELAPRLPLLERTGCIKGLTFDHCGKGSLCQGDRICASIERKVWGEPCGATQTCGCLPEQFKQCSDSAQCEQGEVCALTFLLKNPICVSKDAEKRARWMEKLDNDPEPKLEQAESSLEPSLEPQLGLTLSECSVDSDCSPALDSPDLGLKCHYFPSSLMPSPEPCNGRDECRCTTGDSFVRPCVSMSDCDRLGPGHICAEIPIPIGHKLAGCISPSAASMVGVREIADFNSTGLSLEQCADYTDCQGDRHCIYYGPLRKDIACNPSSYGKPCICIPNDDFFCEKDADCVEEDEVCASAPIAKRPLCVSKKVMRTYHIVKHVDKIKEIPEACPQESPEASSGTSTEGSEPTSQTATSQEPQNAACIDARVLRKMEKKELVFERDVWAEVLCDASGNCATSGHMVIYAGRPVMMKTYCDIVGCDRTTMYVNSPRLRRKLRVKSNSKDLEYTAFAARYSTRAEEKVLSIAVRVGF